MQIVPSIHTNPYSTHHIQRFLKIPTLTSSVLSIFSGCLTPHNKRQPETFAPPFTKHYNPPSHHPANPQPPCNKPPSISTTPPIPVSTNCSATPTPSSSTSCNKSTTNSSTSGASKAQAKATSCKHGWGKLCKNSKPPFT